MSFDLCIELTTALWNEWPTSPIMACSRMAEA